MNRSIILIFFLFAVLQFHFAIAQTGLADNISYSLQQKPKFFITLASFNTFIDHNFASIDGLRAGLAYNQTIRFGAGIFGLANNQVVSTIAVDDLSIKYETNGELNFTFGSLSAEYYFFNQYPWQFTFTPFQIGIGSAHYEYIQRSSRLRTSTPSELIILYQPELSAQYNIFRWLGLGLTTGYRFPLLRSRKQTQNLSAITFAFDVRLSLDEIYKLLFEDENQ